jgi:hypothetical protein
LSACCSRASRIWSACPSACSRLEAMTVTPRIVSTAPCSAFRDGGRALSTANRRPTSYGTYDSGELAGGGRALPLPTVRLSSCAGLWHLNRDGGRLGQFVGEILRSDESETQGALAGHLLRRLAAFRASRDVRRGRWCEAQPAVWAAEVGHRGFFPGRPCPHSGQTRSMIGRSEGLSSSSKYTRWRPSPDTRRPCQQSGHV